MLYHNYNLVKGNIDLASTTNTFIFVVFQYINMKKGKHYENGQIYDAIIRHIKTERYMTAIPS